MVIFYASPSVSLTMQQKFLQNPSAGVHALKIPFEKETFPTIFTPSPVCSFTHYNYNVLLFCEVFTFGKYSGKSLLISHVTGKEVMTCGLNCIANLLSYCCYGQGKKGRIIPIVSTKLYHNNQVVRVLSVSLFFEPLNCTDCDYTGFCLVQQCTESIFSTPLGNNKLLL